MQVEYTLDELVTTVASRLAAVGLDRQANGQVSAFPDRRTLRYYTTIGLMDRPDTVRGRQAIYGDRHVAQAVAVKRLQAAGLALTAVQARLAGLPPTGVDAIASGRTEAGGDGARDRRRGFWAQSAVEAPATALGAHLATPAPPAVEASAAVAPGAVGRPRPPRLAAAAPHIEPPPAARTIQVVTLAPGVELHLAADGALAAGDVAAIGCAAAVLLHHLATAGLLPGDGGRDQHERHCR